MKCLTSSVFMTICSIMEVSLSHDVRRKNRSADVQTRMVRSYFDEDQKVSAYMVRSGYNYSLNLKTTREPCINDTWTFKLLEGNLKEACKQKVEHDEGNGRKYFTIKYPNVSLRAYDVNQELQMSGIRDRVTLNLDLAFVNKCDKCDVFFVEVEYFNCKSRTVHRSFIPLALYEQE